MENFIKIRNQLGSILEVVETEVQKSEVLKEQIISEGIPMDFNKLQELKELRAKINTIKAMMDKCSNNISNLCTINFNLSGVYKNRPFKVAYNAGRYDKID